MFPEQGVVDRSVFDLLLEMDDEESDREFSRGIASEYLIQAEAKWTEMDLAL